MVSKSDLEKVSRLLREELDIARERALKYIDEREEEKTKDLPLHECMQALANVIKGYSVKDFVSDWVFVSDGRSSASVRYTYHSHNDGDWNYPIPREPEIHLKPIDLTNHPMYFEYIDEWKKLYNESQKNLPKRKEIERKANQLRKDVDEQYHVQQQKIRDFLKEILTDGRPEEIPSISITIVW
jgi:predicted ribosome quality control (RQC) complex YloA/Tae2 family protein